MRSWKRPPDPHPVANVAKVGQAGPVLPPWARPRSERRGRGITRFTRLPRFLWRHKILTILVILLMVGAGSGLWLWTSVELPANPVPQAQTSFFYDMHGQVITRLPSAEDRRIVRLDAVSPHMISATIAAEDRGFYRHSGIDPGSTLRALWVDIRHGGAYQGGSTITQQLVKNVYVGTDRNLWRKVREAVLSVKLEHKMSKNEILELYLNTVYFGRGAYGVQAAAQTYFTKDARDLDQGQSAFLAGLIRSPNSADPVDDPGAAAYERNRVVDALLQTARIDAAKAAALRAQTVAVCPASSSNREKLCVDEWDRSGIELTGGTAYFLEYVRQQLEARYGKKLYTGGYKIYTTIDPRLQGLAEKAVADTLNEPDDPSGALVAVDPSGAVRAMVGGRDFSRNEVNLAVGTEGGGSGRQPGSTFKPFVLAAAIQDKISVDSSLPGGSPRKVDFDGTDYDFRNYGNSQFGSLSLTEATVRSVNTAYATLGARVTLKRVVATAKGLGVKSRLEDDDPRIVVGKGEVSVLEMASAYCTFASRGMRAEPRVVTKVVGPDGKVIDEFPAVKVKAMEPNDADQVNWVLRQVITRGTGGGASIGRPAAGKTGTTDNNIDAWFVGYTPDQLCTAVWMGYPESNLRSMSNVHGVEVTGGSFPAEIWATFMKAAVEPFALAQFVEPDFTGKVEYIGGARRPVSEPRSEPTAEEEASPSPEPSPSAVAVPQHGSDPSTSQPTATTAPATTAPATTAPATTAPEPPPTTEPPPSTTRPPIITLPTGPPGGDDGRADQ